MRFASNLRIAIFVSPQRDCNRLANHLGEFAKEYQYLVESVLNGRSPLKTYPASMSLVLVLV